MDELVEIARFCFGLGPSDRATQQEDEDAEWEETRAAGDRRRQSGQK